MKQSLQPDPMEQRIIDLVPLLVKLGRTEDSSVIPESGLPNAHFADRDRSFRLIVTGCSGVVVRWV